MKLVVLVVFTIFSTVHSLNILIANTDHWVAKNSRFLKSYLEKHGHQVKLVSSSLSDSNSLPVYSINLIIMVRMNTCCRFIKATSKGNSILPMKDRRRLCLRETATYSNQTNTDRIHWTRIAGMSAPTHSTVCKSR